MTGIYIHVPFCQSRCVYCDFYSTTHSSQWQQRYVEALEREMLQRQGELPAHTHVRTIYIGGGTPSQLQPQLLQRLFQSLQRLFPLDRVEEVTIEANPDDITPQWLEALRQTPVNRISMGVQTFDDERLRLLRRRHTAQQTFDAVALCREYGFDNLSLDLIYGLPGQTLEAWQPDVDTLLQLCTPHLSAYALSYEEGTPLMHMLEQGLVCEVDEEVQWQMYDYLMNATARAGLEHYEISNFALPGMHSRHNSSYWDGTPYLGFGPGAHSYDGAAIRRANNVSLEEYVQLLSSDHSPRWEGSQEHLTASDLYDELVMTRLRTARGLPLTLLTPQQRTHIMQCAEPYLQSGKLLLQEDVLRLHRSGIFTSNDIISDLMW